MCICLHVWTRYSVVFRFSQKDCSIPQEPQQRLCSIFNIQYSILVLETSTVILRDLVVRGTNRGGLCKLDANLAATLDSGTHSA